MVGAELSRIASSLAAVGVVAVLMSGCSPAGTPIPDPGYLLCVWTSEDGKATFRLGIEGELEYQGVDAQLLFGEVGGQQRAPIDGAGTGAWRLGNGLLLRDSEGHPIVELDLDQPDGTVVPAELIAEGSGKSLRLIAIGDIDSVRDDVEFTRSSCEFDDVLG